MTHDPNLIVGFLETVHPYDSLPQDELARVATSFSRRDLAADQVIYTAGEQMEGLFLIMQGAVEVIEEPFELGVGGRWIIAHRFREGRSASRGECGEAQLIGEDLYGLREVQGAEIRIGRNADRGMTELQLVVLETGALRTEDQRDLAIDAGRQ